MGTARSTDSQISSSVGRLIERPGIAIANEGKSFWVNCRKERDDGRMLGTASRGRREADTAAAMLTVAGSRDCLLAIEIWIVSSCNHRARRRFSRVCEVPLLQIVRSTKLKLPRCQVQAIPIQPKSRDDQIRVRLRFSKVCRAGFPQVPAGQS